MGRFTKRKNKDASKATRQRRLSDRLALDRTRLANERTFLAYFRTFIVMMSSGFAIIKLDLLIEIKEIGFVLVGIAPIIFIIGLVRIIKIKRELKKLYWLEEDDDVLTKPSEPEQSSQ